HALAAAAGISDGHAGLRPEDTARRVAASAPERPTAMSGDGINHPPALAGATAGIAMGAAGCGAARGPADAASTGPALRRAPPPPPHRAPQRGDCSAVSHRDRHPIIPKRTAGARARHSARAPALPRHRTAMFSEPEPRDTLRAHRILKFRRKPSIFRRTFKLSSLDPHLPD